MAPRKRKDDHVVMRNGHPFCLNCGEKYIINLPAPISVAVGAMKGFVAAHKSCPPTWTAPVAEMTADISDRALWWLENGERGVSSETMFVHLVDPANVLAHRLVNKHLNPQWCHPHDPSDFRRCHQLLETVPELRRNLPLMRSVSPVWVRLVDNWDKLTEMLLDPDPNSGRVMYEFMRKLIEENEHDG